MAYWYYLVSMFTAGQGFELYEFSTPFGQISSAIAS